MKVSVDFSKLTDAELEVRVGHILTMMTANLNFPEPSPDLETIQSTLSTYSTSLKNVVNGTPKDTIKKNNLRKTLEDQLHDLGYYVQVTSGGNAELITSTGFDMHKPKEPVGPLDKPEYLKVTPGKNSGTIQLKCSTVAHATYYVFEYRELIDGETTNWKQFSSSKSKTLLTGLTNGKQYAFRAAGAASDPSRVWSDQIISYVL